VWEFCSAWWYVLVALVSTGCVVEISEFVSVYPEGVVGYLGLLDLGGV